MNNKILIIILIIGLSNLSFGVKSDNESVRFEFDNKNNFSGAPNLFSIIGLSSGEYTLWSDQPDIFENRSFYVGEDVAEILFSFIITEDSPSIIRFFIGESSNGISHQILAQDAIMINKIDDLMPTTFFYDLLGPIILIGIILAILTPFFAFFFRGQIKNYSDGCYSCNSNHIIKNYCLDCGSYQK